MQTTPRRIG